MEIQDEKKQNLFTSSEQQKKWLIQFYDNKFYDKTDKKFDGGPLFTEKLINDEPIKYEAIKTSKIKEQRHSTNIKKKGESH